jgi:transposase InsO family protein
LVFLALFENHKFILILNIILNQHQNSALAGELLRDLCHHEGIQSKQLTLHSDNGSPMKGSSMLATLQQFGVMPSFSRPSVSNDNPYSESLFKTLKYRPKYPLKPFADVTEARQWVTGLGWNGITTNIATALSALSLQRNVMKAWTISFWITVKPSTRLLVLNIRNAGAEVLAIGKKSKQSTLTQTRPKQKKMIPRR